MLAILLSWFLVHLITDKVLNLSLCVSYINQLVLGTFLVLEHLLNQTIGVSNFTEMSLGEFSKRPVIKADTMCSLLCKIDFGYIRYLTSD